MGKFSKAAAQAAAWASAAAVVLTLSCLTAQAQSAAPQPATPPPAVPAAVAPPPTATPTTPSAAAPKQSAKLRECTRLPLSDIQVGKDKTIEVARLRLDEYVAKVGKQRGWKSWDKSLETITCEDYLFVPLLGQEYKCLVTATFCKKS